MSETDCSGTGDVDCGEVLDNLERYLDGELPPSELGQLAQHLGECFPCADRQRFEEQLRSLVRRGCAEQAPESLLERIRLRLDEVGRT